jgi:hypothetical protein
MLSDRLVKEFSGQRSSFACRLIEVSELYVVPEYYESFAISTKIKDSLAYCGDADGAAA